GEKVAPESSRAELFFFCNRRWVLTFFLRGVVHIYIIFIPEQALSAWLITSDHPASGSLSGALYYFGGLIRHP
ncbi:MAG: hypothetical protein LC774_13430, partial [Acidobacteria bacterium]|nr:hypothetical protein [Acidobacteriota bacterium]